MNNKKYFSVVIFTFLIAFVYIAATKSSDDFITHKVKKGETVSLLCIDIYGYYSNDLGAAFIKGMRGDHPRYLKAAACAKHYAVHSGPEALRHEFNAIASPKDLSETYLPAFKECVDAGVEAHQIRQVEQALGRQVDVKQPVAQGLHRGLA